MQPRILPLKAADEPRHPNYSTPLGAACLSASLILSALSAVKMAHDEVATQTSGSNHIPDKPVAGNGAAASMRLTRAQLLALQSAVARCGARLTLSESGLATLNSELEAFSRHYLPSIISARPGTLIIGENVKAIALSELDLKGIALDALVIMKSTLADDELHPLQGLSSLGSATIQMSTLSGEFLRLIAHKELRSLAIINDHELASFNWRNLSLLKEFHQLEHLALAGKGLSIEDLKLLPELKSLKSISLSSTDVDPCALLEGILVNDNRYPALERLYIPLVELSHSRRAKLEFLKKQLRVLRPGLQLE
jgi:hypothetical protein